MVGLLWVGALSSLLADEARDIGPETPVLLTTQDAQTLVRPGGAWFTEGSYANYEGFGVAITSSSRTSVALAVKAGPRTNLGRHVGSVAGQHGGRMDLEVVAVLDENGHDIFDRKPEQAHSGRVSPSKFQDGHYSWARTLRLSPRSEVSGIREIKLRAVLTLPVDWVDFTFDTGKILEGVHPRISKADTTRGGGILLSHPAPWTDASFFVVGMDASGGRLPVSSASAGKTKEFHAFNFNRDDKTVEKIRVMIATGQVRESVEFSLRPFPGNEKPITVIMNRAVFADSLPTTPRFVFTLNGVAYSTVEDLMRAVDKLPKGSRINWARSPYVYGSDPLNTEEELKAFEAYCKDRDVRLSLGIASE